jgi:hypothetical protein
MSFTTKEVSKTEVKDATAEAQSECNGLLCVYVLEMGNYHDTPGITRVFRDDGMAKKHIPKSYIAKEISGYFYYASDEKKRKWATVKKYKVE